MPKFADKVWISAAVLSCVTIVTMSFLGTPQAEGTQRQGVREDEVNKITTVEGHTTGWVAVYDEKTKKKICLNVNQIESFYPRGNDKIESEHRSV